MILMRVVTVSRTRGGRLPYSLSRPSIRKRTQNSFSYGSMWMSEAPRR